MQVQDFQSQTISMTQVRRDVGELKKILARHSEAWVMRNQQVMFVAVDPGRYQILKSLEDRQVNRKKLDEAILAIDRVRDSHGEVYGSPGSDAVVKSRDERRKKWQKKS